MARCAKRRAGWIDWAKSQSKKLVMHDLINQHLPVVESELPANLAWEVYRHQPEFIEEKVLFDQFQARLIDHRALVEKKMKDAAFQLKAYEHDLMLYPEKKYHPNGRPVWQYHPAKQKLRDDVANAYHLIMTPMELKKTQPEYDDFTNKEFKERVYQEQRAQKFNYYVEQEQKFTKLKRTWGHEGRYALLKDAKDSMMEL